MRIVGIDPGTSVSSPAGFADFDSEGKIYDFAKLISKESSSNERVRDIAFKIGKRTHGEHDLICIEQFVMRGKGGQTLQRMIGASIYSTMPIPVQEVFNTTVKRIVGGKGSASKQEVADGVYNWFASKNDKAAERVAKLYQEESWDILDAFAIGIAGYLLFTGEVE